MSEMDRGQAVAPFIRPLFDAFTARTLLRGDGSCTSALSSAGWVLNKIGDGRAIVTNPTIAIPELHTSGIAVKFLTFPRYAKAMDLAYEEIRPVVEAANYPLLFPLVTIENAVVYPYVHGIVKAEEDYVQFAEFIEILKKGGVDPDTLRLRLSESGKLRRFDLKNGTRVFTDPWEDTNLALKDAAEQYGL